MKRVIILQIVLLASVAAAATDPNLVGWWKLDDGTGAVAADSAGSKNGAVYGATWATGQVGGALSFDGANDSVELPTNSPIWLPQNDLTVSTWAYFYRDPLSNAHDFLLDLDFNYRSSYPLCSGSNLLRTMTDGKAVFQITTTATETVGSNDTLMKNKWYHIVGVRRGTTLEIYLDGQLNGTGVCSAGPIKLSGQCLDSRVIIGKMSDGCATNEAYFLYGMVDDVRIYNRALSAEEIQQLYESSFPALTNLEITGPDEVAEESTAAYKAIAHYDNGTTKDVTALAEWRVEPNNIASIEAGLLATGQALYPKHKVKVYAEYTEEQTTVDANLTVSVLAICPQGSALKFDGVNDYVSANDSPALALTNQITVCAWVKRDVAGIRHNIVAKHTLSYPYNGFHLVIDQANGAGFALTIGGSWQQCGGGKINAASWHHLAGTFDGTQMKFFLNGNFIGSKTASGKMAVNSNKLYIGRAALGFETGYFFDGTIDDVRIYNRALSAKEIETAMYSKPTGSDPNLVAYWDFDEGSGQTATDVSGHGNNGTLGSSNGIDTADPCWVESEAPVGRCTTEQVMLRNLLGATDDKEAANQLIADAKAKERASVQLITELQKQMNGTEKMNATRAKAQISVAIVQEEMVSRQIDATIKRLEDALRLLNYEVDSNGEPTWFPPWHPWPGVSNKTNAPNWPSSSSSYGNKPAIKAISIKLR